MDRERTESALQAASRHVVENLMRVEQLQELVAEAKASGEDPAIFLSALALFRETLAKWRAVREELERSRAVTGSPAEPSELAYDAR